VKLSVVVPTYERLAKLAACLDSIASQDGVEQTEVVVVDDGSRDGTREWLDVRAREPWPFALRIVHARHRGPAAARNAGVLAASGDAVLFTGDDCSLAPGCLAPHIEFHAAPRNASLLGHTTWLPSLEITPFMHYQENGGSQFAYGRIADRADAGWRFYYTTNISTSRELLLAQPFDERFPAARYEDLELGFRLARLGHRVSYEPRAVAWHDHPIEFADFRARSVEYGEHAVLFHQLHEGSEELAVALGIRDAEQADRAFRAGIERAEQLVAALEPSLLGASERAFGVRGARALLHDAYRLLIHYALVRGIRKALSLPEPEAV